jgi:hypothetical protein
VFSFSSRQQQQRETLVIYNNKTLLLVLLLLCCCWELCVNVGVALCIHSRSAPNPTYLEQSGLLQSSYILQLHLLVLSVLRGSKERTKRAKHPCLPAYESLSELRPA